MKNVIIFHGTDDNPDKHWYGWLRNELEMSGYSVTIPDNPTINHESIKTFLPKAMSKIKLDTDTILVGHSAGGPLILSILEQIDFIIPQAILVSGYARHPDEQMEDPVLQEKYNWAKIKKNVKDIIFINSIHDPWSCTDVEGRYMFDYLGGTQIIRDELHFGADKFNDIYPEFPLLKKLILGGEK